MKGYTKIRNDFIDWLVSSNLDAGEFRVLFFLIRKIIGWNKSSDLIPISQFVESTKLSERMVIYSINKLIKRNLLTVVRRIGKVTRYSLPVQRIAPSNAMDGIKPMQRIAPFKRNKETIQKDFKIEIRNGTPIAVQQIINSKKL